MVIEKTRRIRFGTLEKKSGLSLAEWVDLWNDDLEEWTITGSCDLEIGDLDYTAIAWQCPDRGCLHWNHVLTFADPSGAIVVCGRCGRPWEL